MTRRWGRPPSCFCGLCRKCKNREYMRNWYRSKTFEQRKAMREGRDMALARQRDSERYHRQRKHDDEYLAQKAAVLKVSRAVRAGRLRRQPCEACGSTDVQAHHDDYSRPLDVRWLCTKHHASEHNPEANLEEAA